jgi:restriction system protein
LAIENASEGADGGVDLVLRKDGEKFFVQCKQWKKGSVGVKPIRELPSSETPVGREVLRQP